MFKRLFGFCWAGLIAIPLLACESREEKYEREARENLVILEKIRDSAIEAREAQALNHQDEAVYSAVHMYEVLALAYFIETTRPSCDYLTMGYKVPESVVSLSCDDNGVATFTAKIGGCAKGVITVTPKIADGDIKFERKFSSAACEIALGTKFKE